MLTLILSLLGLGSMGGAFAFFGPATIIAFVKGLPWQVWAGVAIAVLLTLGYCHAEKTGETKGAAKVTAKVEKQHAQTVAEAKADSTTAQTVTDKIGATVKHNNQLATDYVATQIEEMHRAIDAPAQPGAAPAPVDTASLSASTDRLIDRANRAADAADAEP